MPLLSGGLVVVETPEEIATPPTEAYREDAGAPSFSWIDPDGQEWPLSNASEDLGWFTLRAVAGIGAAPIEITADVLPRGGESVRHILSKSNRLQWPLEIFGSTHEQFVERYRRISRAFTLTTRRELPGVLRIARPNGSVREIWCFYEAGLEAEGEENHLYARPVITLYCPEGKWRAAAPVVAQRTFTPTTGDPDGATPDVPVTFFSPFLSLASSSVVGSGTPVSGDDADTGGGTAVDDTGSLTTITNPGDVDAWPIWTVTGPMSELRAWNETTGTRFALTYSLSELQTITITTDRPTVRGPGDANLSRYVDWFNTAGTTLWSLTDGPNVIGLEVDGAGPTTSVRLEFVPRFDNS